jgi:arylsulfatase A-like enzyme
VPLPDDRIIDGLDLLPLLRGAAPSPRDRFVYYDVRNPAAIRYQNLKYVRRNLIDISTYWPTQQGPFLFDLENDPSESYSLFEEQPERAAELSGMLDEFEAAVRDNLRGWL